MGNGKGNFKSPKKSSRVEKVELFEYRINIGGQEYAIQTANQLNLESLSSKKGSKSKITGKELVSALKSYGVNVLMPGIENFEWQGKPLEEKEPVYGGIKQMMGLLSEWESVPEVGIEFVGKGKVAKSDLVSVSMGTNPFTGETKKA
jgi:hypothetical protein